MRPILMVVFAAFALFAQSSQPRAAAPQFDCFLLTEVGVGEIRRAPAAGCTTRVTPQSTFKVPHAIAALDAGVVAGLEEEIAYDGASQPFESWRRSHTLDSALHYSVVWYFQEIARRLGAAREAEYARKFDYGNRDTTSGLTSFWLGGSLAISPEEQERFMVRLFDNDLPASRSALDGVRTGLIQPPGAIVNASGPHPFAGAWPAGTVVRAKTGSGRDASGVDVRWLVGHVARGSRSWVFVSCVAMPDAPALAAVDLAARSLTEAGVL